MVRPRARRALFGGLQSARWQRTGRSRRGGLVDELGKPLATLRERSRRHAEVGIRSEELVCLLGVEYRLTRVGLDLESDRSTELPGLCVPVPALDRAYPLWNKLSE